VTDNRPLEHEVRRGRVRRELRVVGALLVLGLGAVVLAVLVAFALMWALGVP